MGVDLGSYLDQRRRWVEKAIEQALPPRHPDPGRLVEAMRYTLLLPAKRLRGIICLAVCDVLGGKRRDVMPLAVAAEMIHASSLILDDLPSFDDARRRRGAMAAHLAFSESTAILAAVGLLNAAYRHLGGAARTRWIGPDDGSMAIRALAAAVGEDGMIAGEALDLAAGEQSPELAELERIHAMKTGSLFIACAVEAGRVSGAGAAELAALEAWAKNLGLAFQITDDLLDAVGDPELTGKDVGRDSAGTSFVAFAGVEGARRLADELVETAVESLSALGQRAEPLTAIARFVGQRDK